MKQYAKRESHSLELCTPPSIPGAIPPTERVLRSLLVSEQNASDVRFALGCVLVRQGRFAEAIEVFQQAIADDPTNAELQCNLGVASLEFGLLDEACAIFRRAILLKPALALPHIQLGYAEVRRGQIEAAKQAFVAAAKLASERGDVCFALARLYHETGEIELARESYQLAFERGEQSPEVINALGEFLFFDGVACYQDGNPFEAFTIWSTAFDRFPRAFAGSQRIAQTLYAMIQLYRESGALEALVRSYQKADSSQQSVLSYELFAWCFFSLGCFPELFVRCENLDREFERWKLELKKEEEGVLPFAHFRLGVLHAYAGALEAAVEELSFARDHLPKSKHRPLRIEPMLRFIKNLIGREDDDEEKAESASKEDWAAAGFADPFQHQAWSLTGMPPSEARAWKEAGFSAKSAVRWRNAKLEPLVAKEWSEAGFSDAATSRRWIRGGFSVTEAAFWNPSFSERPEVAIQCREAGFNNPDEASAWLEVFMFPWEAERWRDLGFQAEEAKAYLARGITDPFIARQEQRSEATEE